MHYQWLRSQESIFSLTFENAEGRITSGTGFKVGGFLVTNNHVVQVPNARRVRLRSVRSDGYTTAVNLDFGHLHFRQMLVDGDPETAWDYAIYRVTDPAFAAIPNLDLTDNDAVEVGTHVALFGYQFEQPHLSMHVGYVSSQYEKNGVHYIQLDSSVNHGNSGGPLIDTTSGRVIGLVTRKATGLTQQFDELLKAFRQNIDQLEAMTRGPFQGMVAGLNPVKATLAIQVQMERIAREISRSANVGIGYAYQVRKVRASLSLLAH